MKLVRRVDLRFFQDHDAGEYGLAHSGTINNDEGFNAFWTGWGIFHDVFEHAHEYTDKHFRGDAAMNIGGEIAAMGALVYYWNTCGFSERLDGNSVYTFEDNIIQTTQDFIENGIKYGNFRFGTELVSNVPEMPDSEDETLEYIIKKHFEKIELCFPDKNDLSESQSTEVLHYKASFTFKKLANLYRYGYAMAKKIAHNNYRDYNALANFYSFWNDFCQKNPAEKMASYYSGVDVRLYNDQEKNLHWRVIFNPFPEAKSMGIERINFCGNRNDCPNVYFIV